MVSARHPVKAVLGALLAVVACYVAYRSWDDARYAYLRGSNAIAAQAVRPSDAFALGKLFDERLQKRPDSRMSAHEGQLIRTALTNAPLSRALLRIIAGQASLAGDTASADKAINLSNAISRRDALTQLWLIERSVQANDMNEAVRHYNAALSVHPELGQALYPILAKAIAFPEVRAAIAPYLERQARWSASFLEAALAQAQPNDIALLILPVGDVVRGEAYDETNAKLIGRLVDLGDFTMAEKLATAVVPGLKPGTLRPLAVDRTSTDKRLGKIGWTLAEDGQILASANEMGGLDLDVAPLSRGPAASRTVPVAGGKTYVLAQTIRGSDAPQGDAATLNWQAFCVPAEPEVLVWQQTLPNPDRTQRYESRIEVPAACKGLEFVLNARGPEGSQAAHVALESFDLKIQLN